MAHNFQSKHAIINPQLVEELIFNATLITVTTFFIVRFHCLVAK